MHEQVFVESHQEAWLLKQEETTSNLKAIVATGCMINRAVSCEYGTGSFTRFCL
jgi:hypothetical protein